MKLRLIQQYFLASAVVFAIATTAVAHWVNGRASVAILGATAETAALYLQSGLQPYIQSLARASELNSEERIELDRIVSKQASQGLFAVIKLWSPDGRLVYAPQGESALAPPLLEIREALLGHVVSRSPDLEEAGHAGERSLSKQLFEIYFPLYDQSSGNIIAVGEVYEDVGYVGEALLDTAYQNWLVIAGGGVALFLILGAIVYRGSRTIDRQVETLRENFHRQEALQSLNIELHDRVTKATLNVARIDENAQRRVGADLHDGAGQLLGFMLLRMDQLESAVMASDDDDIERRAEIINDIRDAATEATREIRRVSQGLVAPHLAGVLTLDGQIRAVAGEHERQTGTPVGIRIDDNVPQITGRVAEVMGRITHEALNNAWKHAGGRGQEITVSLTDKRLNMCIRNESSVDNVGTSGGNNSAGLGVIGMKFRAETLGGTLEVENISTHTIVTCSAPIEESDLYNTE